MFGLSNQHPIIFSILAWMAAFMFTYLESVDASPLSGLRKTLRRYLPLQWFLVWAALMNIFFRYQFPPTFTFVEMLIAVGVLALATWTQLRISPVWPDRYRLFGIVASAIYLVLLFILR